MKANELMIGDFVYYIHTEDGIAPYEEVIRIQAEDLCQDACIIETHYEPIPITQEILEKNGFVFDGSGQRSMMFLSKPQFAEGLRFNIYVGLKRRTIEVFAAHPIERLPNWRKSNKVYLEVCGCYVHELQHALRLCGIEKEIVL